MGTMPHPEVLMMDRSNVPMRSAMSMISSLSNPMRGRSIGKPRSLCSARMFMSVWEATCPRESPMTIPEAPMLWAKRLATCCMVLLQRTHWSLESAFSEMSCGLVP